MKSIYFVDSFNVEPIWEDKITYNV